MTGSKRYLPINSGRILTLAGINFV